MNIPYADPRHPFHKKSAFDLGDAGAGIMANDLGKNMLFGRLTRSILTFSSMSFVP
jgi:Cu2+-containing amine oxidase